MAGSDPVYVDHILHPTITDASFVTEVHHINGAGEDAGVVYSEMQARENTAGDLMALQCVSQHSVLTTGRNGCCTPNRLPIGARRAVSCLHCGS
jgi:Zn-dependent M16 (insulinase) family peptidase